MRHILRDVNRRRLTAATLAATVLVLSASLTRWPHATPPVDVRAAPTMEEQRSGCRDRDALTTYSRRSIEPSSILGCERATVTVTLGTRCDVAPLDVVLSFDHSASMGDGKALENAKKGVYNFLKALDIGRQPATRVGLVVHGSKPDRFALTDNAGRINGIVSSLSAEGDDNLPDSITAAINLFKDTPETDGPPPRRVIVIFSDGETDNDEGKEARAESAARTAEGQGIDVLTVCLKNGFDRCGWLGSLTSNPAFRFKSAGSGLVGKFRAAAETLRSLWIESIDVGEFLPVGMRIVEDSARPPLAADTDLEERTLAWKLFENRRRYDGTGIVSRTISYQVELSDPPPTDPSDYVFETRFATFDDSRNLPGTIDIPTATLHVAGPCPSRIEPTAPPKPSPPPPPHTPTPESPPPPAELPTQSPIQAWPTSSARYTIALPIAQLDRCDERKHPPDTVILLDVSHSMKDTLPDGRSKLAEALYMAELFVQGMKRGEKTAILTFADDVREASDGLTTSGWRLKAILSDPQRMSHRSGTRIDRALAHAIEIFKRDGNDDSAAGRNRRPVIILVTDGRTDAPDLRQRTLSLATAFKGRNRPHGYAKRGRIYTVAVEGEEGSADQEHLEQIASTSRFAFVADSAASMRAIPPHIARTQHCAEATDKP